MQAVKALGVGPATDTTSCAGGSTCSMAALCAPIQAISPDGTLSIFGTIIDSLAPVRWKGTGSTTQLAALARELAANDWQARVNGLDGHGHDGRRGAVSDRNVELLVYTPFTLALPASEPQPLTRRAGIRKVLAAA